MATWRERFEDLSAEQGRQIDLWKAGNRNHDQVINAGEAIKEFFRLYGASQYPDRDEEMPGS